jgi:hypothetical protein
MIAAASRARRALTRRKLGERLAYHHWLLGRLVRITLCGLAACTSGALPAASPSARGSAATAASAIPGAGAVGPGTLLDAYTEDGELQHFRIDSVTADPRDRDGDVRLYGVSVVNPATKAWQPYCIPDIQGLSAAIPVQGSWTADGEPQPGAGRITFACTSGAIGKCIRFGYKPWKTIDGVSLASYHAACIRMVRADYCGDGRPHTVDGTWIDIWDGLGIQTREQRPGHPEIFEAAWSPTGAAYLNMPRWSDDVADVVRDCPTHFAGRTSRDRTVDPSDVPRQFPEVLIFDARYLQTADRRFEPATAPH